VECDLAIGVGEAYWRLAAVALEGCHVGEEPGYKHRIDEVWLVRMARVRVNELLQRAVACGACPAVRGCATSQQEA
jgi:hypothetical protein